MSIRSLLTLGLLAAPALAVPHWKDEPKTIWETKYRTKFMRKTRTVHHHAATVTVTEAGSTVTAPGSTVTEVGSTVTALGSTVTVPGSTITAPGSTVTAPGSTITAPGSTVTLPGVTVTEAGVCPTASSEMSSMTSMTSITSVDTSVTSATSVATTASSSSSADTTGLTTTILATATATSLGLDVAAKAAGKRWFGTAADIPGTGETSDPYYLAEFNSNDFGEATPGNTMKFDATEPQQNVFNYAGGDQFVALAKSTGKEVRCHNLIWGNQISSWVTNPATPWTNATLSAVLINHVKNVVAHFGDDCYSWDVVNEAFADSPAGSYLENVWYNTIGEEYVPMAFAAAQEVIEEQGLSVKLYYNDYNIETLGAKSTAAQNLVTELKGRGIQIDGVGLESHFIVGSTPGQAAQVANMRAFTALGVDVAVTELDIRTTTPATAAAQIQQVQDYYNTVAACVEVDGCIGVVVWDFDDFYSWVPNTFAGQGYADLFFQPGGANTPLVKKAAYDGVLEALTGEPEAI